MRRALAALALAVVPVPALAQDGCDTVSRGGAVPDIVEAMLFGTKIRAGCGFDISADIAFWEGMIAAHGCDENNANQIRSFWVDPQVTPEEFSEYRKQHPFATALICTSLAEPGFPESYAPERIETLTMRHLWLDSSFRP